MPEPELDPGSADWHGRTRRPPPAGAGSVVNRCGGGWSAVADAPSTPRPEAPGTVTVGTRGRRRAGPPPANPSGAAPPGGSELNVDRRPSTGCSRASRWRPHTGVHRQHLPAPSPGCRRAPLATAVLPFTLRLTPRYPRCSPQAGAITNAASLTASVSPARSRHYSNYLFENPYRAGDSQTGQKNSEHQKEQHWIA